MSKWHQIRAYISYRLKARSAHGIHSPFVYKLIETVIEDKNCTFDEFGRLDGLRKQLLNDTHVLNIEDLGAGSNILKSKQRRVCDIARHGITKRNFSEFYFKLINYFNAQTVIELGTSLGLNTLYLARSGNQPKVYSIEGSIALHQYAQQLLQTYQAKNVQLLQGNFDAVYPSLLKELKQFDFLLIDGNHTYEATMHYFHEALSYVHEHTIIVMDDIYWSEGMTRAWEMIKAHPKVRLTLDFYYCGIVFFKTEFTEPLHFSIIQP